MAALEIIFEDEHYIAINKPAGVMVHKTPLERDPDAQFAVQILRDQIGIRVFPLHRIDRPTSGVLLFAKSSEAASRLQPDFASHQIAKYYLAVLRGYLHTSHGYIEAPLSKDLYAEMQEAKTEYWILATSEIPLQSSPRYPSSRYSLAQVFPHTGRMHQIRRHFAHDRHYVIGDSTHGDNKQNRFFREQLACHRLLLHAWQLAFVHPYQQSKIYLNASPPDYFVEITEKLGLSIPPHPVTWPPQD